MVRRPRKAGLNTWFNSSRSPSTMSSGVGCGWALRHHCMMRSVPVLDVRMITVLRKLISRPSPSSSTPLSNTWKNSSSTSGWAFSTSSSSTTLYGLRRTASVSTPPSP
ncbi:hypothetical protein D3C85_1037890 [compost metagenome]